MKNMEARKGPRIEKTDLEGIYWAAQQAYTKRLMDRAKAAGGSSGDIQIRPA